MANWLRILRRWLRKWRKPKSKSPRIIKRWYTKYGAILQIERSTPGARATLRIVKPQSPDYLLVLDYLCELQGDFIGEFNGTAITLRSRFNATITQTHRFAIFAIASSGVSRLVNAWDVDLEGFSAGPARVRLSAGRALLQLAFAGLREKELSNFDWVGILEEKIRVELGSPSHRINATLFEKL